MARFFSFTNSATIGTKDLDICLRLLEGTKPRSSPLHLTGFTVVEWGGAQLS